MKSDSRLRRPFVLRMIPPVKLRRPKGFETWLTIAGAAVLASVLAITIFADYLTPYSPIIPSIEIAGQRVQLPILKSPGTSIEVDTPAGKTSLSFPWGTDQVGRDVFTRAIHGSRFVMLVALFSTLLSSILGVPFGLLSGFFGGKLDRVISLVMDAIYSFPGLVLAIAIAALLGPGVVNLSIAIAVVYIPSYFRVVRGQVLSVKELPYVEAARALGAGWWDIIRRYVFPNVIPSIAVVVSLNFADAIITEAGLTFLGLGIPPPTADWGFDLNKGQSFFLSGSWWIGAFPGLMIVITVLGFSLLGEGLNELLNPKLREQV